MPTSKKIRDKIAKLQAEFKTQKEKEEKEERDRKNDTRIKILIGAFVKSEEVETYKRIVNSTKFSNFLFRDTDRKLFGLNVLTNGEKEARHKKVNEPNKDNESTSDAQNLDTRDTTKNTKITDDSKFNSNENNDNDPQKQMTQEPPEASEGDTEKIETNETPVSNAEAELNTTQADLEKGNPEQMTQARPEAPKADAEKTKIDETESKKLITIYLDSEYADRQNIMRALETIFDTERGTFWDYDKSKRQWWLSAERGTDLTLVAKWLPKNVKEEWLPTSGT
jgi:hypothetical protein